MMMLIYSMTNSLVFTLRVYLIWKKQLGWYYKKNIAVETATCGSDLFLSVPVWRILLILVITSNDLVYLLSIKYACLEITNMLLTVPSTLMPSYIITTLHYHFINCRRLLYLMRLPSAINLWDRTQMISYQIIGSIVTFGGFFIR